MFSAAGTFWDVLGSASQTLFDAATLRHRQRAAERALEQAAAQYRGTVLTAFQNVADALHAIYSDADELKAATASEQAARVTLELTEKQLKAGYVRRTRTMAREADQSPGACAARATPCFPARACSRRCPRAQEISSTGPPRVTARGPVDRRQDQRWGGQWSASFLIAVRREQGWP